MALESPWNDDAYDPCADAEDSSYACLTLARPRSFKKKPVLTIDAEELEQAHQAMYLGGAQQLEAEDETVAEQPPRTALHLLGLSSMGSDDHAWSDDEAEAETPALAEEEPLDDDELAEEDLPSLTARSLDHLLRPASYDPDEDEDDSEDSIPSIEAQLQKMRGLTLRTDDTPDLPAEPESIPEEPVAAWDTIEPAQSGFDAFDSEEAEEDSVPSIEEQLRNIRSLLTPRSSAALTPIEEDAAPDSEQAADESASREASPQEEPFVEDEAPPEDHLTPDLPHEIPPETGIATAEQPFFEKESEPVDAFDEDESLFDPFEDEGDTPVTRQPEEPAAWDDDLQGFDPVDDASEDIPERVDLPEPEAEEEPSTAGLPDRDWGVAGFGSTFAPDAFGGVFAPEEPDSPVPPDEPMVLPQEAIELPDEPDADHAPPAAPEELVGPVFEAEPEVRAERSDIPDVGITADRDPEVPADQDAEWDTEYAYDQEVEAEPVPEPRFIKPEHNQVRARLMRREEVAKISPQRRSLMQSLGDWLAGLFRR